MPTKVFATGRPQGLFSVISLKAPKSAQHEKGMFSIIILVSFQSHSPLAHVPGSTDESGRQDNPPPDRRPPVLPDSGSRLCPVVLPGSGSRLRPSVLSCSGPRLRPSVLSVSGSWLWLPVLPGSRLPRLAQLRVSGDGILDVAVEVCADVTLVSGDVPQSQGLHLGKSHAQKLLKEPAAAQDTVVFIWADLYAVGVEL